MEPPKLTSLDRALVGWSLVFVVSQSLIARLLGPVAPRVLEVQTAWSARRYAAILAKMDDDELARYRSHFYPDFVHPLIYAIALRTGVARLHELAPTGRTAHALLSAAPAVSAAGDYVENVAGLYLLAHRDRATDGVVRAVSTVSIVKWILALGVLGYLTQGFARIWLRALRRG
ncbi:hypothetical protein [Rhodococcus sp. HNM0569]|uniref:hypothetical protein n=1 Tax=Rhodococcus sp. HNM0569 TaxID=2716340 RepID=UPI00146C9DC9|nr:hypothetical protein [Rhodococcus sp. HNM0569]NLU81805.1 hypothetical protein [Rhodococcus sp. HNM0569]